MIITEDQLREALEESFHMGWSISGEGYNSEYGGDDDSHEWKDCRDRHVKALLASLGFDDSWTQEDEL